ncbi:hypothetical protein F5X97DRAFT_337845 [Nemania serpens]|nr:hypothetical protein F5X97DRAFT_337845 [Nemania serpens]
MLDLKIMRLNLSQLSPLRHLQYQAVKTVSSDGDRDEDSVSTTPSSATVPEFKDATELNAQRLRRWHSTQVLLVISSICFFFSLAFFIQQARVRITDERCTRRMSAPSPVLDAVRFEWTTFNDVFQPDEYSGYPSASSEAAWGKLWDFGAFSVPTSSLAGLNKSSATGDFRFVGKDGVGGLLEGAHQIHCLNLVRQFIYRDHWDYSHLPSFSGGDKTRRAHVDHCIETLRMVFTCNSDVTPYTLRKSSISGNTIGRSYPRKCRVYSGLVGWVNSHSVFDSIE